MINSHKIASKEPSSAYSRYKWIGELFYKHEDFLFLFCLIINLAMLFLIVDLLSMLMHKKLELIKKDGIVYKNRRYFVSQNDISNIELSKSNNQSAIFIFLKSTENVIKFRKTLLEKLQIKSFLFLNKNKIQIRLTFLENGEKNFQEIQSFILS